MGEEVKSRRSVGATLKYAALIAKLEDDKLYTAATISRQVPTIKEAFELHSRITKSLGFFSRYHRMSEEPDGTIKNFNAWLGSTWKRHVKPEDIDAKKFIMPLREEERRKRDVQIFLFGFGTATMACFDTAVLLFLFW